MSWSDLDTNNPKNKELLEKRENEQRNIAKNYHACFTTPIGQKVMEHLMNTYVIHNSTDLNAVNVVYESGYHAGEAGVVKAILNLIQKAEVL
jgi:hypothetical protein